MDDARAGVSIVLVTAPDMEVAEALAHSLVHERLATCVNLLPSVTSLYRWEGAVHKAGEVLLMIKTTPEGFEALRSRVVELHPYEVPEILELEVRAGDRRFMDWVRAGVGTNLEQVTK
jgi:periplasmic divalent cation tolerance protein